MNNEEKYYKYKAKYLNMRNELLQNQKGSSYLNTLIGIEDIQTEGKELTPSYKIYTGFFRHNEFIKVSPFHGINLYPDFNEKNVVNMIVEIPKGTQEKLEINKEEALNPIMYDIKDGKVRKVVYQAKNSNIAGYPFHYGALPQTWEHNGHQDTRTGEYGDNDPIDAFDISDIGATPGLVKKVKILGAFAMIDDGETDWKLICIDINDPNANNYNDLGDVPRNIFVIMEDFLKRYKTPDGKPENRFANPKIWYKDETLKIVKEVHNFWIQLVHNKDNVVEENKRISIDKATAVQDIQIVVEN